MAVTDDLRARARGGLAWPVVLPALAVVLLQIAYPLTPTGVTRDRLTVTTVVVFFAASLVHAVAVRGWRFAGALVLVTAGGGFVVEALGVATGLPFGAYRYTPTLGWTLLDVPVVIPLAWTMMGYPAYTVACRIASGPLARTVIGGWALASWDLFLDPQMVDAGHWVWESGGPAILGIPISNFAGWFLVATVMMTVLVRVPARPGVPAREAAGLDDRVPYALYLWTYFSSVLAHAAFFDLPGSAALGGVGMGVVVVAFLRAVRR